ncbi:hypothetical protein, partial [Salmonella enterica]
MNKTKGCLIANFATVPLSFPFQLRFLFASRPEIMGWVLGIVYRVIATHLVKKAGHTHQVAKTGA